MSNDEERQPLTSAEVYRLAREAGTVPPFDLQRGLDDLRGWIDREVDVEEPEWAAQVELRGREGPLTELLALARRPGDGPAVLAGEGGAGKSTLAAALAERVQPWDRQVWWVSAVDPATFSAGLAGVARDLGGSVTDVESITKGADDGADRLWHLLDHSSRAWLLVLDGADDPRMLTAAGSPAGVQDGMGWARPSQRGLVLVTSRETDPRMWAGAQLLTVGHLSTADAAQILRDLAPGAGTETEARALAGHIGGLPLALHLAGTYLRSGVSQLPTFAAYDHAFGRAEGTMVARTAEISLAGLARTGIPQARHLLLLASCYASDSIPTRIIPMAGLDEALDGLRGVGLIRTDAAAITLHPVVTDTNRAHIEGPEVWHTAIANLAGVLEGLRFDRPDDWPRYRLLGQHMLALLGATTDRVDREHLTVLVDAAADMASAFNRSGDGKATSALCRAALVGGAALGGEHPTVLSLRHLLAWATADEGDPARAEAIYEDVLGIRRRVLGEFHHDTIESRHEYAWIATCLGRWAEAEQRYRDALRDSLTYRGPDASGTLTTRHELAHAIARQGRLEDALSLFEDVLRARRRVLGDTHAQTLQTRHELAWITAGQSDWARAEAMYRELVELRGALGTDHPHVLLTQHELAWTIARQDRRTEAESLYEQVLKRRVRVLGDDHPDTARTRWALSELRRGQIVDATHPA